MTPSAIYSKSGKGVQEASGKTSILSRGDRAVLSAFDGKVSVGDVAERVGKAFDAKFEQLVTQLEKDGFIRLLSAAAPAASARPAAPARAAPPPAAKPAGEELDFTALIGSSAPKPAAPHDLAAKARADAERLAKEAETTSWKARQETETRTKAEVDARSKAEVEARSKAAAQARAQADAFAKAREEAEIRARAEAQAKAKAEAEAQAKIDAESRAKSAGEAEARVRAEAEAKVKAARDAAVRLAAEAKSKAEAEMQAKLEAERAKLEAERVKAKEEADRQRKEAEELRQRLEEAERKAKEAEERRRKEEEERKAKEEAERKAREEREAQERAERERADKERREKEEAERKARQEQEARERAERERAEKERREKEEAERKTRQEQEARERAERERAENAERAARAAEKESAEKARQEEARRQEEAEKQSQAAEKDKNDKKAQAAPAPASSFSDSLLADLDSFSDRDEEERKAQAEAEAVKKKAEQQARAEAERKAKQQEAELAAKADAARNAKEAAERQAKEDAERKAREDEERAKREAEERKRQARESMAAKQAADAPKAQAEDDDIGVKDEDLDMDEVERDAAALSKESRRAAREREREREKEKGKGREREQEREDVAAAATAAPPRIRRPMKWGKPLAIGLFALLVIAVGVVHVMPVSTAEYEDAASEALGVPVKIGAAHLSLLTGVELKLEKVTVGSANIAHVRAHPAVGALFGEKKSFSRIELDGATVPQQALAQALFGKTKGTNFEVGRVVARQVKLEGPLPLPPLDVDIAIGADGTPTTASVRGTDNMTAKLALKNGQVEFEMNASSFTLPFAPELTLSQFGMKGTAGKDSMDIGAWSATLFDGVLAGNARLVWGNTWNLDGTVTVRGMNVAVFAPALVSEGRGEGTGKFMMSGVDPAKLGAGGRLEGNFSISKGVLGSIDITRALQTGGRQSSGRTPFTELSGQAAYDKGAVSLRNISIGAGALNVGASADIAQSGALSGRIVADVKTPAQTLRTTLNLGGTVKEPQVRN